MDQRADKPKIEVPVMWQADVKAQIHRLVWWLLDCGAPGHMLQYGWQVEAARQLGLHRATIKRHVDTMMYHGIMRPGKRKGEMMLNMGIFARKADPRRVRMMKVGKRGGEK